MLLSCKMRNNCLMFERQFSESSLLILLTFLKLNSSLTRWSFFAINSGRIRSLKFKNHLSLCQRLSAAAFYWLGFSLIEDSKWQLTWLRTQSAELTSSKKSTSVAILAILSRSFPEAIELREWRHSKVIVLTIAKDLCRSS